MDAEPDMSRLARTIGDATRVRMLILLTEDRALTAKELAYGAGVKPATATAHLRRLEGDRLVSSTTQGRHKYFRLTSPDVAHLVESLMVVAPAAAPQHASDKKTVDVIRLARLCYDHLAGKLGVQLTAAMVARGLLVEEKRAFSITADGEDWFETFGIDIPALRRNRRQFAYQCLDWSERKSHLAGSLGAAVAQRMIVLGWLVKAKRSRVVSLTEAGQRALMKRFGISLKDT
jgi:DNA-binding transcriptional ArsR family regulator